MKTNKSLQAWYENIKKEGGAKAIQFIQFDVKVTRETPAVVKTTFKSTNSIDSISSISSNIFK